MPSQYAGSAHAAAVRILTKAWSYFVAVVAARNGSRTAVVPSAESTSLAPGERHRASRPTLRTHARVARDAAAGLCQQ